MQTRSRVDVSAALHPNEGGHRARGYSSSVIKPDEVEITGSAEAQVWWDEAAVTAWVLATGLALP